MLRRSCTHALRRAVRSSRALLSSSAEAAAAPVALRFQEFKQHPSPPAAAPLVILHGLLGQSNNWRSFAQRPEIAGDRRVLCADLRNHGDSPHSDRFDYASLVADLVAFLDSQSLPSAILLGHSLGGRAAMATALLRPDRVQKLIVGERKPGQSLMSYSSFTGVCAADIAPVDNSSSASWQSTSGIVSECMLRCSALTFLLRWLIGFNVASAGFGRCPRPATCGPAAASFDSGQGDPGLRANEPHVGCEHTEVSMEGQPRCN
jgi:pimeloyl-ACP methyl ester carboxylesterase